MLATIFAILALIAGALGSLTLLTLCMACGANSTPQQIHAIKMWMLAITAVGLLAFAGGIWLTATNKAWLGAGVGVLPAAALVVLIVWVAFK